MKQKSNPFQIQAHGSITGAKSAQFAAVSGKTPAKKRKKFAKSLMASK